MMAALGGTTTAVESQVKDFTGRTDPIPFRIGDEVFYAASDIPTHTAFRIMDLAKSIGNDEVESEEQFARISQFFEWVLLPGSTPEFLKGLESTEKPIGIKKCMDIIRWLLGEWGLRPTVSSSDSSTPPEEPGQLSMDGASSTE